MSTKQEDYWKILADSVSEDRLAVYAADGASPTTAAARYLWNISVSEALYAPLQMFEVGLRNAIDHALVIQTGQANWYDVIILNKFGKEQIKKAKKNINKLKRPVTPGRVIAELNLGFWVSMFESDYEGNGSHFLPSGIKLVFPNLQKSMHNRKKIKAKLEKVRALRNRVFHHERIIHWGDLTNQHQDLVEMIGWINKDLRDVTGLVDSFQKVYGYGTQPFLDQLDQITPNS